MDTSKPAGIRFDQIYLHRANFMHREGALNLPHDTPHPANFSIGVSLQYYRSTVPGRAGVGVTVATDPTDQTVLYHFQVEMVALAGEILGEPNMPISEFMRGPALVALVPFLREAIANLTMRGRFGPVWLHPMNLQQILLESGSRVDLELRATEEVSDKEKATA
ncbi:MAG: hypothetical protein ACJ8AK_13795 [Gemmatimonadaceae bacterium]